MNHMLRVARQRIAAGFFIMAILLGVGVSGVLAGLVLTVTAHSGPALAAGPRPLFQLPFPCGESWHLATYPGHDDYDIDMTANSGVTSGRAILASYQGTVSFAGWDNGAGWYVKLNHGSGWESMYLHMIQSPMVTTGQSVVRGQQLGKVGSTGNSSGPHLHYEQRADGAKVESWFNGVPSGITTDGFPAGEPQSPAVNRVSNNCVDAPGTGMVWLTNGEYNQDGYTDLLAIEASTGKLWLYPGTNGAGFGVRVQVGTTWGSMTHLTGGEYNRDAYTDLLAVDGAGVLWLYPGFNGIGFGARVQVGTSWGGMTQITGGEHNEDGYTDLLAIESGTGKLWLYPGINGTGFGARIQVGTNWGSFTQLTAGEYNEDSYADMLTVDGAGVLWLYPGVSGAGFTTRVQVGTSWNTLDDLTGGEFNRDSYIDLLAVDPSTGKLWLYPGLSGAGFGARIQVGSGGW